MHNVGVTILHNVLPHISLNKKEQHQEQVGIQRAVKVYERRTSELETSSDERSTQEEPD